MTETKDNKRWNDAAVATLTAAVTAGTPVSAETVTSLSETLGVSVRSVASKLRQLDYEVESMAKVKAPTFTPEQGAALADLVNSNPGVYTYKDLETAFPGNFTAKQIQGKLLALELTDKVKPAEKVEVALKYTEAEEAKFVSMANAGAFIEDIAAALGKEIPSVRGKALSLTRSGQIREIPKQKESHAKDVVDAVAALGDAIHGMTVAEIAVKVDKTERGTRTLLTRRGIKVADHDGKAKKEKAAANRAAA